MSLSTQLAARFREVTLDGTWVANTNFKSQLEATTWTVATHSPPGLNSIALLTFHIHYYIAGLLRVFEGGELTIRDRYSFDMPAITSPSDWETLVAQFLADAEKFASHVEKLTDDQLYSVFVDVKYGTWQRNIDGMIEHAYYHLGQIVIIHKIIKAV